MGVNRENKRKVKKGCGCKLCKPHKGLWEHFFNPKVRAKLKAMKEQINEL